MRDRRGRSSRPRPLGEALERVRDRMAPKTPLAAIQTAWPGVAGPQIAAVTEVTAERDGTVTIECASTVWAQELEMMSARLLTGLADELGDSAPEKLRFRVSR